MNRVVFTVALLCGLATSCVEAQGGGAPRIKCEVGTAAWRIAAFDGSIGMRDAGESRIWTLQARTSPSGSVMEIFETKACSDDADEMAKLGRDEDAVSGSARRVAEYVLNSNGCKLRFEIPGGESGAMYRQVMLYGILVGPEKKTQLYKVQSNH